MVFVPFLLHQYSAYQAFCVPYMPSNIPPWCSSRLPFVYGYVQEKYWNVGFLRYWTISQVPNILLATPVLVATLAFCALQLKYCTVPYVLSHPFLADIPTVVRAVTQSGSTKSVFMTNKAIIPHAAHALILSLLLLFAAHTQIALRLAASLPTTYWAAAWLMVEHPRTGKWWVTWSVVWGALSIILWAVFLPPA